MKLKNKKIAKVVIPILVVIALVLFFVASPLMKTIYYNPTETLGDKTKHIDLSLKVLGELNFAMGNTLSATTTDEGYGKYKINLKLAGLEKAREASWELKRGEFDFEDVKSSFVKFGYNNGKYLLNHSGHNHDEEVQDADETVYDDSKDIEELNGLQGKAQVDISLKESLPIKEILKLKNKYNCEFLYVGVQSDDHVDNSAFGMCLTAENGKFKYDENMYPYLMMDEKAVKKNNPKVWEEHWNSLMKYSIDDREFHKALNTFGLDEEVFAKAYSYTQKKGVHAIGVTVYGNPKEILKIKKSGVVDRIRLVRAEN